MPQTRNRAWRRAQRVRVVTSRSARVNDGTFNGKLAKQHDLVMPFRLDKNWKLLYTRHVKVKRAKTLGYLWPHPARKLSVLLQEETS